MKWDFENRKKLVLVHCPRGKEYYCDGTPNKSIDGWKDRKPIGKCPHRKKGKCTYLKKLERRKEK